MGWVKVGPITVTDVATTGNIFESNDMNEACKIVADWYNDYYLAQPWALSIAKNGKFGSFWEGNKSPSSLGCTYQWRWKEPIEDREWKDGGGLLGKAECKEGGTLLNEKPDGCYVWKEVEPLKCPESPPLEHASGGIACNDHETKVCTYVNRDKFWSNDGADIAEKCLIIHEEIHRTDPDMICKDGWLQFQTKNQRAVGELAAYVAQERCLNDAKAECGLNPLCHLDIWEQTYNAETRQTLYQRQLEK